MIPLGLATSRTLKRELDGSSKEIVCTDVEYDAEPQIMMGWHKKNVPHPEDAALRIVSEVLTGGRSSRLEKLLVEERQIAASISTDHEFPGLRWDNLFFIQVDLDWFVSLESLHAVDVYGDRSRDIGNYNEFSIADLYDTAGYAVTIFEKHLVGRQIDTNAEKK